MKGEADVDGDEEGESEDMARSSRGGVLRVKKGLSGSEHAEM